MSKHVVLSLYWRRRLWSYTLTDVLVGVELVEQSRGVGEGRNGLLVWHRSHLLAVPLLI